jgi:GrpB-like predicted nucleotidyltransferase (UPF0157 family)
MESDLMNKAPSLGVDKISVVSYNPNIVRKRGNKMNAGQKLFQDYLKANAEAVKRFQEENEKLRNELAEHLRKENK